MGPLIHLAITNRINRIIKTEWVKLNFVPCFMCCCPPELFMRTNRCVCAPIKICQIKTIHVHAARVAARRKILLILLSSAKGPNEFSQLKSVSSFWPGGRCMEIIISQKRQWQRRRHILYWQHDIPTPRIQMRRTRRRERKIQRAAQQLGEWVMIKFHSLSIVAFNSTLWKTPSPLSTRHAACQLTNRPTSPPTHSLCVSVYSRRLKISIKAHF